MKRLLWLCLALLLAAPAWAHKPSDSYLTLDAESAGTVNVRWDIALRDLDYVLQLDRDGNGELNWGEVRQRAGDIERHATARLELSSAGQPCAWQPAGPLMLDRHSDGTYAVLTLAARCERLSGGLDMRYGLLLDVDPTHRGLVQWRAPGTGTTQALVFGADSATQRLTLEVPGTWTTLRQYLVDGVWHIWIGFDHILFLLALLLPAVLVRRDEGWVAAPRLRGAAVETLKVVTAFTLAHSITLSLAALGVISLPSRLVESLIAASVVAAALNNLRGRVTAGSGAVGGNAVAAAQAQPPHAPSNRRWVMAFVFGLIHGFGFASVLADLGLPQGALVLALVGFNVGVELGQLAIVAVFLPLAFWLRGTAFYQWGIFKAGSVAVALLAGWWLLERAFEL